MSIALSFWADYIKERENVEVLETNEGFATYQIKGLECYIRDIYIAPGHRGSKLVYKLADQIVKIAKEKGCKYLTGSVCPSANNCHISMLVLINYGMKLHSSINNLIYFIKLIDGDTK